MQVFGMGLGEFAIIVVLVLLVVLRVFFVFERNREIRRRRGEEPEDLHWWELF